MSMCGKGCCVALATSIYFTYLLLNIKKKIYSRFIYDSITILNSSESRAMTSEVPVMGMEEQAQVRLIQDKTTSKKANI